MSQSKLTRRGMFGSKASSLLWKSSYSKPDSSEGFKNAGNTCYVNACVQVLLGLPFFTYDLCSAPLQQVIDYMPDDSPLLRCEGERVGGWKAERRGGGLYWPALTHVVPSMSAGCPPPRQAAARSMRSARTPRTPLMTAVRRCTTGRLLPSAYCRVWNALSRVCVRACAAPEP